MQDDVQERLGFHEKCLGLLITTTVDEGKFLGLQQKRLGFHGTCVKKAERGKPNYMVTCAGG